MKNIRALLTLSLITLGLSGCGQSGSLYLPPPAKAPTQSQGLPQPVPLQAPGAQLNQTDPAAANQVLDQGSLGDIGNDDGDN